MKKVTIVCLTDEKQSAIQSMQQLGTLHVTPIRQPQSAELDELRNRQARLNRAISALVSHKQKPEPQAMDEVQARQALDQVIAKLDELDKMKESKLQLTKDIAQLKPWGVFTSKSVDELRAAGLHIAFCVAPASVLGAINVGELLVSREKQPSQTLRLPEGAITKVIGGDAKKTFFVVVSTESLDDCDLPLAPMPDCMDLPLLESRLASCAVTETRLNDELDKLAATSLAAIRSLEPALQSAIDFAQARDGMGSNALLAYIAGYIPDSRLDAFLSCARKSGWAVRYEDVKEDDTEVPTLLNIPKKFAMAQSIFDFVGILPGYFETDVSVVMFLFLSLFCGMLIGDAGYGVLLMLLTGFGLLKAKSEASRKGLKVLLSMSACVFLFGALSGNWFGIPSTKMPFPLSGLPWLSEDGTQEHIKLLCFFIGAFHTSLAHAWCAYNQRKSIKDVIGNLGWALFLWANFFAAAKLIAGGIPYTDGLMYALYGIGFVAILTCSINWKNFGDVIYSPFSFINSFVDILSYIRLFAVGLSGVYIASSFNDMASAIWNANPWLIPVGLIILFLGHLLNIARAALSILVHGIRLNTLEFSGHIGLTWSGKPYKPLKQTEA